MAADTLISQLALLPHEFVTAAAGVLGLFIGSFLNVCIDRYVAGASILWPPSHCDACGRRLSPLDLIPVLSWLIQRGRCRTCGAPVSVAYPISELATGALFAAVGWVFGATPEGLVVLIATSLFVVLSGIDMRLFILPDRMTLPAAVIALPLSILVLGRDPVNALAGGLIGAGVFWALSAWWRFRTGRDGLGLGDVKLMLSLGFLTGGLRLPLVVLIACSGALAGFGVAAILRSRSKGERTGPLRIPFGPFLCAGAWVTLLWGDALWSAWLGLLIGGR